MLEVLRIMSKKYDSLILAQMRRRGQAVLAASASAVDHDDGKEGCARSPGVPSLASRKIVMRVSPVQQILRAILHAVTFGIAYCHGLEPGRDLRLCQSSYRDPAPPDPLLCRSTPPSH
ncbi:hypothetical protein COL922a_011251, partial [Colletotrichum nupharicola]